MGNQEMFFNIISAELKRLETSIQKSQNRIRNISDDAKEKYQSELHKIEKHKDELAARMEAARVQAEAVSKEIKSGIEYGIDDLKKAIDKVSSRLK